MDEVFGRHKYKKFIAGEFELKRDERHQIGFRLAKKLGHGTVYGVDYQDPIDVNNLLTWANDHGQAHLGAQLMASYLKVTAKWNVELYA